MEFSKSINQPNLNEETRRKRLRLIAPIVMGGLIIFGTKTGFDFYDTKIAMETSNIYTDSNANTPEQAVNDVEDSEFCNEPQSEELERQIEGLNPNTDNSEEHKTSLTIPLSVDCN